MSKTKLFIDSDIILDVLLEREEFFESSANILNLSELTDFNNSQPSTFFIFVILYLILLKVNLSFSKIYLYLFVLEKNLENLSCDVYYLQ